MTFNPIATKKSALAKYRDRQTDLSQVDSDANSPYFTKAIVREIDLSGGQLDGINPKNSIRAEVPQIGVGIDLPIFYPLFSGHFMLPLKIGEQVFVIYENKVNTSLGYWLSRVPELHDTDNVNYVNHADKVKAELVSNSTIEKRDETTPDDIKMDESFITGNDNTSKISNKFGNNEPDAPTAIPRNKREDVPIYRKESTGDLVIQGSNNTLITLTVDREDEQSANGKLEPPSKSGTIDIVAGRSKETVSLRDDRARLIVSMKTSPDIDFETTKQGGIDEKDVSAVIGKADDVRFIARNNIIIETQPINGEPNAIVMKPNGDIIIHGKNIRIGSDKATTEHLVLGDTLKDLLEQLIDQIGAITVPTAVGPSGIPMNKPVMDIIKQRLGTALSNNHFTEK